jgi:hypothetical protein
MNDCWQVAKNQYLNRQIAAFGGRQQWVFWSQSIFSEVDRQN